MGTRLRLLRAVLVLTSLAATAPSNGNLVILPTFDSTITNDPNAAQIETTIFTAINQYHAAFADNITVNITFQEMTTGLGQNSTPLVTVPYSSVRAQLMADQKTANDAAAVATLPSGANNPVNGNTDVLATIADAMAMGLSEPNETDGVVSLNTSIMNLNRVSIDPTKYDLQSVVEYQIDQVLGLSSALTVGANLTDPPRVEDLFRYSAPGVRSYTTNINATAYFSIDGGTTNLAGFSSVGDLGAWNSSSIRVQNAFGTPGVTPNLGVELTALDVIGYDLIRSNSVPEPATLALLGVGLAGLGFSRRKSKQ